MTAVPTGAEDWPAIHRRLAAEYEPLRGELTGRVRRAMHDAGLGGQGAADAWFDNWIVKAADELRYLGLGEQARLRSVEVHGLDGLAEPGRGPTVLAGTHLDAHTLGLVHLDTLGVPSTIVVHEKMLPIVANYGMRHAEFVAGGAQLSAAVRRVRTEGGVLAAYADVDGTGAPVRVHGGRIAGESPITRLIDVVRGSVVRWRLRPNGDAEARRWSLELTPSSRDGLRSEVERDLTSAPERWMLWRQVPVAGLGLRQLGWHGSSRDREKGSHGTS